MLARRACSVDCTGAGLVAGCTCCLPAELQTLCGQCSILHINGYLLLHSAPPASPSHSLAQVVVATIAFGMGVDKADGERAGRRPQRHSCCPPSRGPGVPSALPTLCQPGGAGLGLPTSPNRALWRAACPRACLQCATSSTSRSARAWRGTTRRPGARVRALAGALSVQAPAPPAAASLHGCLCCGACAAHRGGQPRSCSLPASAAVLAATWRK